jgi:hypothetical protein
MKILTATSETNGRDAGDFDFCRDGELLRFGMECDGEDAMGVAHADRCGCSRSLAGVESSKATTTFRVVEVAWSPETYARLIEASLVRDGWVEPGEEATRWGLESSEDVRGVAEAFPVGTILRRRGERFFSLLAVRS